MITIRNKEGLIKALCEYKEFTYGGHVKAWEWDKTFTIQDYKTVLLVKYNGALLYFNNKFYSNTTSRLQNLLKKVFNIVAPERKAYLFDTEPKEMYYTDAIECYRGSAFFNSNGSLSFFAKKKREGDFVEFIKCNKLPQEISLKLGNVYYGLETKLLRGED